MLLHVLLKDEYREFPGCPVVKNPPANAEDTGSNPGPGRSHKPRGAAKKKKKIKDECIK